MYSSPERISNAPQHTYARTHHRTSALLPAHSLLLLKLLNFMRTPDLNACEMVHRMTNPVSNSGVKQGLRRGAVLGFDVSDFDRIMEKNALGYFHNR